MYVQLRIARPVSNLALTAGMYCEGLGFEALGSFVGHGGVDGIMLGIRNASYHLEFTCCTDKPVIPSPTAEDLLVFYIPDSKDWQERCLHMCRAGFVLVEPGNPYWNRRGNTFIDPDGYRTVLYNGNG